MTLNLKTLKEVMQMPTTLGGWLSMIGALGFLGGYFYLSHTGKISSLMHYL